MARSGSEDKRPLIISSPLLTLVSAQYQCTKPREATTNPQPEANLQEQRRHFHWWEYRYTYTTYSCLTPPLQKTQWLRSNPVSLSSLAFLGAGQVREQNLHWQHKSCRQLLEMRCLPPTVRPGSSLWQLWAGGLGLPRDRNRSRRCCLSSSILSSLSIFPGMTLLFRPDHRVITEALCPPPCPGKTQGDGARQLITLEPCLPLLKRGKICSSQLLHKGGPEAQPRLRWC